LRIVAVDHGEKRIGLAITDPSGNFARPLGVIEHISRLVDAAQVSEMASRNDAGLIVVGQSFDEEGRPNLAGRRAARFAEALRSQTSLPVVLWDEAFTTQEARAARLEMGASRKDRGGHQDALAAVMILRSYIEAHSNET
jgi:putative Holliday junction resolvase